MFGLQKYGSILNRLYEEGFEFSTDWNAGSSSKTILMRHDVDFSVEDAFSLARFENSINVNSTYFFMLSSNMYNLLSKRNRFLVNQIKEMNHKVSLHFDPTVYSALNYFIEERGAFQSAFDVELDIVSIHRPGKFLTDNNVDLFGTKQTYQDQFFKERKYISDSGGSDVSDQLDSYIRSEDIRPIHILIHPVWWVNKLTSPTDTLINWQRRHFEFITEEIRSNCKTYVG